MNDQLAAAAIVVNGRKEAVQARTLDALLGEKGVEGGRGVAIALNGAVVPRSAWATTALKSGDEVEIVQARQGG